MTDSRKARPKRAGTYLLSEADAELQVVMRDANAAHWELTPEGKILVLVPKKQRPRRSAATLDAIEVDLSRLNGLRERLSTDQPLQDFEAIECLKKSTKKRASSRPDRRRSRRA